MSGIATNRTNITLPVDVSNEIIAKVQEGSAVMKLARKSSFPAEVPLFRLLLLILKQLG